MNSEDQGQCVAPGTEKYPGTMNTIQYCKITMDKLWLCIWLKKDRKFQLSGNMIQLYKTKTDGQLRRGSCTLRKRFQLSGNMIQLYKISKGGH